MPKRSKAKLYARRRSSGAPRWYGDFREFARWGGRREPLVAPGETRATTDPIAAQELFTKRLRELADARENDTLAVPIRQKPTLAQVVREYVQARSEEGRVTASWAQAGGIFLGRAVAFFGPDRRLGGITADDVLAWLDHLRSLRLLGRPLGEGSLRHHLNAFSGLFRRAQRRRYVPQGFNPVALLERDERPALPRARTAWLEVPEAARLLWAAKTYPVKPHEPEMRLAYPIIATFLLAGGRAKEVLGLGLRDVSLDAETVTFRPHPWHRGGRLKTEGSERVVPLWPQLREILEAYLDRYRLDRPGELLFPSPHLRTDRPISDLRDMLDRVAVRAGFLQPVLDERSAEQARGANGRLCWTGRRIRTRPFRVSYTAARLQTLDRGAPVSLDVVAAELGHASREMAERVYKRIGKVRHRSEAVEFRWEQWYEEQGGGLVERKVSRAAGEAVPDQALLPPR